MQSQKGFALKKNVVRYYRLSHKIRARAVRARPETRNHPTTKLTPEDRNPNPQLLTKMKENLNLNSQLLSKMKGNRNLDSQVLTKMKENSSVDAATVVIDIWQRRGPIGFFDGLASRSDTQNSGHPTRGCIPRTPVILHGVVSPELLSSCMGLYPQKSCHPTRGCIPRTPVILHGVVSPELVPQGAGGSYLTLHRS